LYSELDAKAEGQCANSIEEIDRFSRGFCDCCPACPKPNEKNKPMEVHDWLRHMVVFLCFFCIVSWMPKQKSNVQTALKKLIVLNGFANKEYVYIYI
jgi:hypothetical protein